MRDSTRFLGNLKLINQFFLRKSFSSNLSPGQPASPSTLIWWSHDSHWCSHNVHQTTIRKCLKVLVYIVPLIKSFMETFSLDSSKCRYIVYPAKSSAWNWNIVHFPWEKFIVFHSMHIRIWREGKSVNVMCCSIAAGLSTFIHRRHHGHDEHEKDIVDGVTTGKQESATAGIASSS